MKIDRFVSIFVSVPFSRRTIGGNTKTYYGGNIANVYLYGRVTYRVGYAFVIEEGSQSSKKCRFLSFFFFFSFFFDIAWRVSFTYRTRWRQELRRLLLLEEKLNRFFFKSLYSHYFSSAKYIPYLLSQFSPLENTKKRKRKLNKKGIL